MTESVDKVKFKSRAKRIEILREKVEQLETKEKVATAKRTSAAFRRLARSRATLRALIVDHVEHAALGEHERDTFTKTIESAISAIDEEMDARIGQTRIG